ncbi:hypothetical protein TR51_28945 [Kitasatospora griseola]|uniref:Uncharacterized protein n=1 Tax=Kitasatospora griseola TaxID=2064 RepID=A0A0D0NUP6_KITGR|nr:hypothetical protein [Kitasatospora griseola]KIQ62916.1 hypothetical protein TR51_28945 [Kitasatospora griseola]
MSTRTAAAQVNPAGALLAMVTAFSDLPAPELHVERLPPAGDGGEFVWGVNVSFHDSLSHFEQWCQALGLDPADVEAHLDGGTNWLNVFGTWSGVRVRLTGFFRFADPEQGQ